MRQLLHLIAGILIALSISSPARAHEGDAQTSMPLVVSLVGGAVIALVFLLLFISWLNFRKAHPQPGDNGTKAVSGEGGQDGK